MLNFNKHDSYGQVLKPGDVCVMHDKSKGLKFCVYKEEVRNSTKGEYGKFITAKGTVTLKFTSVVFVFDTLTDRRGKSEEVTKLVRGFYEEVR